MRRFEIGLGLFVIGLGLFVTGSALCGAGFDLRWAWLAACEEERR